MEKRQRVSVYGKRIVAGIVVTLATLAGIIWTVGTGYLGSRGWQWIGDALYPSGMTVVAVVMAAGWKTLVRSSALRRYGRGILLGISGFFLALTLQNMVRFPLTFSQSENGRFQVLVRVDRRSNEAILYRTRYGLFRHEQARFAYPVKGSLKLRWLTGDVCTMTYRTVDGSVHQSVATFGDRGDPISYHNMISAISGQWQQDPLTDGAWRIRVDSEGIRLENGDQSELYAFDDCVPFGTLALVLCRDGLPQWTLVLTEDGVIDERDLFVGGHLILCEVAMESMPVIELQRSQEI